MLSGRGSRRCSPFPETVGADSSDPRPIGQVFAAARAYLRACAYVYSRARTHARTHASLLRFFRHESWNRVNYYRERAISIEGMRFTGRFNEIGIHDAITLPSVRDGRSIGR